jgi:hypothetical protein
VGPTIAPPSVTGAVQCSIVPANVETSMVSIHERKSRIDQVRCHNTRSDMALGHGEGSMKQTLPPSFLGAE